MVIDRNFYVKCSLYVVYFVNLSLRVENILSESVGKKTLCVQNNGHLLQVNSSTEMFVSICFSMFTLVPPCLMKF